MFTKPIKNEPSVRKNREPDKIRNLKVRLGEGSGQAIGVVMVRVVAVKVVRKSKLGRLQTENGTPGAARMAIWRGSRVGRLQIETRTSANRNSDDSKNATKNATTPRFAKGL